MLSKMSLYHEVTESSTTSITSCSVSGWCVWRWC